MAEFVKQHYLPAVYLQNFCIPGDTPGRKARVWHFNGTASKLATVDSLCFEKHCYSKANAAAVEKHFAETESQYGFVIGRLGARKQLPQSDYPILLAAMIDFHIRNTAHENVTGEDGLVAYNARAEACRRLLIGRHNSPHDPTDEELKTHLETNWTVRIVTGPASVPFCASDNPCVWLALSKTDPKLDLMILPLTPDYTAVAYDRRSWHVQAGMIPVLDAEHLNTIQCLAAQRLIFSHQQIAESTREAIAEARAKRSDARPYTTRSKWSIRLFHWPGRHPSFLQEMPIRF